MTELSPSAPAPAPAAPPAPTAPVTEGATPPPQPAGESNKPTTPTEGGTGGEATPPDPKPAEGTPPDPNKPEKPEGTEGGEGEEATPPEKPPEGGEEAENHTPDLKSMSRTERAQYFQTLEANTRKAAEAKMDSAYQPDAVDDLVQKYVDQGHSEFEAKMLARDEVRDQEADIAKARAARAELNSTLAIEATEVLNTVDWLNPDKKDSFDETAADAATTLYDLLCLTRDDNTNELNDKGEPIPGTGQIIGAAMTPKQFYGLIDKIRSSGVEGAKVAGQRAAEEQMAQVAAPSSNSNKRDPDFDNLSNEEKRARLRAQGHIVT